MKSHMKGREPAHRLPNYLLPLPRLRGRAGVGVLQRNKLLEFSPTRRFAPTSPLKGEEIRVCFAYGSA